MDQTDRRSDLIKFPGPLLNSENRQADNSFISCRKTTERKKRFSGPPFSVAKIAGQIIPSPREGRRLLGLGLNFLIVLSYYVLKWFSDDVSQFWYFVY